MSDLRKAAEELLTAFDAHQSWHESDRVFLAGYIKGMQILKQKSDQLCAAVNAEPDEEQRLGKQLAIAVEALEKLAEGEPVHNITDKGNKVTLVYTATEALA